MTGMTVRGGNGSLQLTDDGLVFTRSGLARQTKHADAVELVPWSRIETIVLEKKSLRVLVAGAPRASLDSDPYALRLPWTRERPAVEALVAAALPRCAGAGAVQPSTPPVPQRQVVDPLVPATMPPEIRASYARAAVAMERSSRWEMRLLGCQLVLLLIPVAVVLLVFIVVAVIALK